MSKKIRAPRPNTLVVDPDQGWGLEYIEKPAGKIFKYNDSPVYFMSRVDGELKEILRPDTIDTQPEKLYRALNWPECKELFKLDTSMFEKLQVGAAIGLVVVLLFFIYLIIS